MKRPRLEKMDKFVRISDVRLKISCLKPNKRRLSEIRTSSEFGIPLYIKRCRLVMSDQCLKSGRPVRPDLGHLL